MKINLKATNLELTNQIKQQVEEKIGALDKYYDKIVQAHVELGKTKTNQNKGDIFFCEINLTVPGNLLRFRHEYADLTKAINESKRGIQQELIKYKEKSQG